MSQSKRARYNGPHLEVAVFDPEGSIYDEPIDTVVKGGLLSADVPARIRDELTASDDWSEVADPSAARSADKKES